MTKGIFITLEGGEGAGKSSQSRMLGEVLTARGYNIVLTREPGGAPGAEAIRKLLVEGPGDHWDGMTEALLHTAARREHLVKTVWPALEAIRKLLVEGPSDHWDGMTEALLHTAARREHLVKTVWPALEAGKIVISDRFVDSTVAYQGYAQGNDLGALWALYKTAIGDFKPRLTLVLDLPVSVGLQRAANRGGAENRYESMGAAFHENVRKGFQEIAKAEPDRCKVIDATQDIESIHKAVVAEVLKVLPKA